ncbi:MAG: M10 family metallopeptidase C-terminal domain-containing protein, partial [Rhodospirillaceae bacterium]|nr:M10 family metallopeptidase C-terminal domain-containing protein [Rhodospirillaceae bacterium]
MCVLCQIDPVNAGNGNHDELVKNLSQTPTPGTSTTSVPGSATLADIPGNSTTAAEVKVGGNSFLGTVETPGDTDWIKVTLEAGKRYVFLLEGINIPSTAEGVLDDPFVAIRDANGKRVAFDDDGGPGLNSRLGFVAPASGTYYVEAGGFQYFTGDYRLTVKDGSAQDNSLNRLADYLTHGFRSPLKFNLGSGGINPKDGVITYTLDGWSQDGDGLRHGVRDTFREAFKLLEAILGIDFRETSSGTADIRFSDNNGGLWAWSSYSVDRNADNLQGYISYSEVNIFAGYSGGDVGSPLFTTILHEIGHALGLGHLGPYNGFAEFYADAKFWNDSDQLSIMSYFTQADNPYIDASRALPIGPMAVDLIALNNLYSEYGFGISNAFTGDTVWGFNTNIDDSKGKAFSELSKHAHRNAFTIIDSGGTDTVDFSGYSADQVIDLTVTDSTNPYATASSIGGLRGNMMLAAGTVIENAIGGSGDDVIIGNAEANVLAGNAGNDRLVGGAGDDTLTGGAGRDRFVYASADTGRDRITDFTGGEDRIDFTGLDIAFADLTIVQGSGADAAHTVISWIGAGGTAQSVTLENIQASSIGEADFLFGDPLEVSISNVEVWEGKTVQLTVSLSRPSWKEVTVWWQTSDGTAGGGDYAGRTTKQKITFKAGETSKVIEIETTDDNLRETSESFSITLSDPQNADLAPDPAATVTIRDDDSYPTVSVADAAVTEGGTAQVRVSLDRPYSKDVTVLWSVSDGTATGGDHSVPSQPQKVTFRPGETSKVIGIDITDDAIHEGSEYFIVLLSDPVNAELGSLTAAVMITDNDPVPQVSVADATVAEGGTVQVTISLDRPSTKEVTVRWSTADGTAGSGDYSGQSTPQTVTFRPGETSKVIGIDTTDDALAGSDKAFTVALSGPSGATLGTDSTATVTIRDNDVVPEISVADAEVTEGGTARVMVSLDRPYSKDVTVWWQTADGTAGRDDHSGPSQPERIVFRAGETSKVIGIDTSSDLVREGDEDFTVMLMSPSGATLGTDWTSTVTIRDVVPPKITIADATVAEGGTARVTVSLDKPSTKDITVLWSVADGTAGGADHSGPSTAQTITFRAGETSKTIEIRTTDDSIHEGSESFTVTLSGPTGATLGTDHTATVTITDNDAEPEITVSDATVAEGGTARVTVSLDRPSSTDITVWWQATDGTAAAATTTSGAGMATICS